MTIKELAADHGSIDLLVAAIMRQRGCSEDDAKEHYWRIYTDIDRLIDMDEE